MIRVIVFIIVVIGCVAAFLQYINPHYKNIKELRATTASYKQALENAKDLSLAQEELQARYATIDKSDIAAVESVLPDNVDNIRLIIQLNSIALKTGMSSLRDIDYTTNSGNSADDKTGGLFGEFRVKFSTTGSYKNFLTFISTLEQNLRLVDISQVTFEVVEDPTKTDNNKYVITLKTYWLKN